jgi:purine-cytosine permease-like protein
MDNNQARQDGRTGIAVILLAVVLGLPFAYVASMGPVFGCSQANA